MLSIKKFIKLFSIQGSESSRKKIQVASIVISLLCLAFNVSLREIKGVPEITYLLGTISLSVAVGYFLIDEMTKKVDLGFDKFNKTYLSSRNFIIVDEIEEIYEIIKLLPKVHFIYNVRIESNPNEDINLVTARKKWRSELKSRLMNNPRIEVCELICKDHVNIDDAKKFYADFNEYKKKSTQSRGQSTLSNLKIKVIDSTHTFGIKNFIILKFSDKNYELNKSVVYWGWDESQNQDTLTKFKTFKSYDNELANDYIARFINLFNNKHFTKTLEETLKEDEVKQTPDA